ncbi:hypothetical protein UY3_17235 [Chelonia mydas]|uniref:Uncharacterized protein n=1 Tax=Chelonia mydas TaxID=8469 RepID=M7BBP5_CHEMY|nr:hypothetical protein UY3_17235 [Chelonia mydas]
MCPEEPQASRSPELPVTYREESQASCNCSCTSSSLPFPPQTQATQVIGSRLYDWSLQGYVAVESLWKDSPKKKKSGKKASDKPEADNDMPVEVHVNSGEERTMK